MNPLKYFKTKTYNLTSNGRQCDSLGSETVRRYGLPGAVTQPQHRRAYRSKLVDGHVFHSHGVSSQEAETIAGDTESLDGSPLTRKNYLDRQVKSTLGGVYYICLPIN